MISLFRDADLARQTRSTFDGLLQCQLIGALLYHICIGLAYLGHDSVPSINLEALHCLGTPYRLSSTQANKPETSPIAGTFNTLARFP